MIAAATATFLIVVNTDILRSGYNSIGSFFLNCESFWLCIAASLLESVCLKRFHSSSTSIFTIFLFREDNLQVWVNSSKYFLLLSSALIHAIMACLSGSLASPDK